MRPTGRMPETANVWGDVVPEDSDDDWYVAPEDRLEEDDPKAPDANALDGGDDLDGWTPGDPV